jgi:hypothetical protein
VKNTLKCNIGSRPSDVQSHVKSMTCKRQKTVRCHFFYPYYERPKEIEKQDYHLHFVKKTIKLHFLKVLVLYFSTKISTASQLIYSEHISRNFYWAIQADGTPSISQSHGNRTCGRLLNLLGLGLTVTHILTVIRFSTMSLGDQFLALGKIRFSHFVCYFMHCMCLHV